MSVTRSRTSARQSTLHASVWKGGHDPSPDTPVPPPSARDTVVVRRKAGSRAKVRVDLARTRARMGDLAGEGFGLTLAALAGAGGDTGE